MVDWEAVREVLSQDCKIKSLYINSEGETCAVGALALAAGAMPDYLLQQRTTTIGALPDICSLIEGKFGLTTAHLRIIQAVNDDENDDDLRRVFVLQAIDRLEETAEWGDRLGSYKFWNNWHPMVTEEAK